MCAQEVNRMPQQSCVEQANLLNIDKYNEWNPMAVFGITERADWTDAERDKMRGLKSSTLAKQSGGTLSPNPFFWKRVGRGSLSLSPLLLSTIVAVPLQQER